jgi:primase-polymerase (primpol)-like protein
LPFHVAVQEWKEHSEFDSKAGAQFWDGIGFEFHPGGPYFGIDLDDCRDPESGNIETIAMEIVRRFNTYTEISPSKTGLKLIGKGRLKLPSRNGKPSTGRRRKLEWSRGRSGEIEVYDRGRYFAMTGDLLEASEP